MCALDKRIFLFISGCFACSSQDIFTRTTYGFVSVCVCVCWRCASAIYSHIHEWKIYAFVLMPRPQSKWSIVCHWIFNAYKLSLLSKIWCEMWTGAMAVRCLQHRPARTSCAYWSIVMHLGRQRAYEQHQQWGNEARHGTLLQNMKYAQINLLRRIVVVGRDGDERRRRRARSSSSAYISHMECVLAAFMWWTLHEHCVAHVIETNAFMHNRPTDRPTRQHQTHVNDTNTFAYLLF